MTREVNLRMHSYRNYKNCLEFPNPILHLTILKVMVRWNGSTERSCVTVLYWQTKEHLTTIHHYMDVVLFFERRNILVRFLALNRWELTSYCNSPWMAGIS